MFLQVEGGYKVEENLPWARGSPTTCMTPTLESHSTQLSPTTWKVPGAPLRVTVKGGEMTQPVKCHRAQDLSSVSRNR